MTKTWGPRLTALLLAFATAHAAAAQQPPEPWITSVGVGTAEAAPAHVTFWLHAHAVDTESLQRAAEQLSGLEQRVRAQLEERGLTPTEFEATGIAVSADAAYHPPGAQRSIRLRFSMAPFAPPDRGPALFTELVEDVRAVAADAGTTADPPLLEAADRDQLLADAVARAVENAFPAAEAAAEVMGAQLTTVQGIDVGEIWWNTTPDYPAAEPSLRRLACTAEVRVTYAFTVRP